MNHSTAGIPMWFSRRTGVLSGSVSTLGVAIALLAAATLFPTALQAAPAPGPADSVAAAKPGAPARAVRLSNAEGHVQVIEDGQIVADPALANQPLFEGSQVVTGNDGRAEIEMEDGSLARLSPNTTLTLSVLQQQGTGTRTELVLDAGLAYFELQPSNAEHSLLVNYGTASFSATSFSVVRLLEDAPPGELAVFSGNVHLERGSALQLDIHGGESLALNASDATQYDLTESIQPDSWDSWNSDRDQVLNGESSEKTAATASLGNYGGAGLADLDANGNWYNVPGQGYVWSPFDAQAGGAGWDPYGYGNWVYYPRIGWMWVSGYSWGYAPFQCGLWNFYDNFGWGWMPGGGCTPWGGFAEGWYGGGGWYNIGGFPRGYRPPHRPLPGPVHNGPHPVTARLRVPPVPVDRRPAQNLMAAAGRNTQPVMIGGHVVEPLRPVAPRLAYNRSATMFVNRGAAAPTAVHPGYYGGGAHPGYPGGFTAPTPRTPAPASGSASHAPSAHSSSGGGGGGGHVASGGGGGGGGHASGGGGGGGGSHH